MCDIVTCNVARDLERIRKIRFDLARKRELTPEETQIFVDDHVEQVEKIHYPKHNHSKKN